MKKMFIFTVLFMLLFSVFAYGDDSEYKFIDAEATGGESVAIQGLEGYYISAGSSGDCVYIVDKYGNRASDFKFKCVYNHAEDKSFLRVRFADTGDLSGFALLDSDFNIVVSPNDYQTISWTVNNCLACDKLDSRGILTYDCYKFTSNGSDFVFMGLTDSADSASLYGVSDLAKERVTAAQQVGLIPDTFKNRYYQWGTSRYDWACLALEAVLLKQNTDLYSYIEANNITLDYDKYVDVVSPNVLLAEELGLLAPTEGRYFYPDEDITRQEAAYTLNCLCELFNIKTTPKKTAFDDDSEIADWAKEAVYNVSGTRVDGTFILPQIGENSFMPVSSDDSAYYLERAVMAVWRLYSLGSVDFSAYTSKFNITDIGCGLYAYQGTEGKWGVYGDNFTVDAFYELPCMISNFSAFNGTFTLISAYHYNSYGFNTGVDFVVFNGSGEIIKTLTYNMSKIKTEKPSGCEFDYVTLLYVTGSNVVYRGYMYNENGPKTQRDFIKRLVSEKIAGEGFDNIVPYGDGSFTAVEISTGKSCILKPDGSFKEYYTEED